MKKSFMNNLKNFVDTNVRHRIDKVSHIGGGFNPGEPLNEDILLVERHFEDIQQFCVDAEKKISNLLQSIQLSSGGQTNLGAYTHNVQAGLNNISHNIAQQAANITSSATGIGGFSSPVINDNINSKNLTNNKESESNLMPHPTSQSPNQYRSSESLSKSGRNPRGRSQFGTPRPAQIDTNSPPEQTLSEDVLQRYKKLPILGFYKFMCKSEKKLKHDSLLALTLGHYSQLQAQLTNLYLTYEQLIDAQCLKSIQHMLETDIPNVMKLKKSFHKSHGDLESLKAKYNGASQKQQQQQQQQASATGHFSNTSYLISQSSIQQGNKLEQLKNELDDAVTRFEQSRDAYEAELFGFVCKEPELVNLMRNFYQLELEYHQKVSLAIQSSSPSFSDTLARTARKFAFGTPLEEHLRCSGRTISPVIELCTHFLHLQALREEGLFRIPGSSIKIKKLKNGINAWFVTLMNIEESESSQQQSQTGHACITALHDLFKNAVGQTPQVRPPSQSDGLLSGDVSTLSRKTHLSSPSDDNQAPSNHRHLNKCEDYNDEYILDVHSLAGLLKLYLRELPEPLFTHALYDNWIACISDETNSSDERLKRMSKVVEQLPKANYENLKHLIKFLHNLTLFHEQNKMTSSNLAIAMAPSLIWSRPVDHKASQANISVSSSDDAQSLNLQMCSFGLSASQHATIIEALINNANQLFPEPSDFTLAGFENLTLNCQKSVGATYAHNSTNRTVKSTSPTGLSTASSSSFSSNASNSTGSSMTNRGHNRKGGSMEGLLGGPQDIKGVMQHNMSARFMNRPASVQIRRDDYPTLIRQAPVTSPAPPAQPPVPNARSHSRPNANENQNPPHHAPTKPRAPPVPPPSSVRHQQERLRASATPSSSQSPRPVSLRGTGTISVASSGRSGASGAQTVTHTIARPSVPPPERPAASALISDSRKMDAAGRDCKIVDDTATKSSHSLTRSVNIRGDFEEVSTNEVDDIDLSTQSNSPVVSLGSISGDSSFDNTSLDRSWSKCFASNQKGEQNGSENRSGTLKSNTQAGRPPAIPKPAASLKDSKFVSVDSTRDQYLDGHVSDSNDRRPAKPPRSASPKVTQSTPL